MRSVRKLLILPTAQAVDTLAAIVSDALRWRGCTFEVVTQADAEPEFCVLRGRQVLYSTLGRSPTTTAPLYDLARAYAEVGQRASILTPELWCDVCHLVDLTQQILIQFDRSRPR